MDSHARPTAQPTPATGQILLQTFANNASLLVELAPDQQPPA